MLKNSKAFGSFSVDDLGKTKKFYSQTLGLDVREEGDMGLNLKLADGMSVFIYPKGDHQPATFTVLNFTVDDIDSAVSELKEKGVEFESYDEGMIKTDENNVARGLSAGMGPDIAWFNDPAGNVLAVLQPK
jgi:predicted enzyme related to lactoylglutathione lyase